MVPKALKNGMRLTMLVLCFSSPANADNGNDLYNYLTGDAASLNYALGFVAGVHSDYLFSLGDGEKAKICVPAGVSLSQAGDVVKKYLADQPERRHLIASQLIREALLRAFPC